MECSENERTVFLSVTTKLLFSWSYWSWCNCYSGKTPSKVNNNWK